MAFDVKQPTFRHLMYKEYKGTRKAMPDELREQVPLMKDVLTSMHITIAEKGGYEADDIIGTLSRKADAEGYSVVIVSGDRDLLQLATDNILVRIPKTKAGGTTVENYYAADVRNLYGVTPVQFIDMKGLMGIHLTISQAFQVSVKRPQARSYRNGEASKMPWSI